VLCGKAASAAQQRSSAAPHTHVLCFTPTQVQEKMKKLQKKAAKGPDALDK
jgi:hypothetical protein